MANPPSRNFGLDVLRAAAIMLVLLAHGLSGVTTRNPLLLPLGSGGYYGVELFFVLSGFLIGGILLRGVEKEGSFSTADLRSFWIRRWFRTLPSYFLFLAVNLALWSFLPGFARPAGLQPEVGSYLIFLQNFSQPISRFFGVSWSLAVEEWFYLTFPLLLLFLLRGLRRKVLAVWLAILVFALVPVLLRALQQDAESWDGGLRKIVLLRLDSVMYGVAAAAISFYHPAWWRRLRPLVWLGLALLAGVYLFFHMVPDEQFIVDHALARALLFPATSLGFMLMLPRFCELQPRGGAFGFAVTRVSRWSYSAYLCHPPLMFAITCGWKHFFPDNRWFLLKGGLWLASVFALSALLFRYFEKPMMDLRDRPFFGPRKAGRKPLAVSSPAEPAPSDAG